MINTHLNNNTILFVCLYSYEVLGCEVIWCIKHEHIGNTFLDKGAAEFLLPELKKNANEATEKKSDTIIYKRKKYQIDRKRFSTGNYYKGFYGVLTNVEKMWVLCRIGKAWVSLL